MRGMGLSALKQSQDVDELAAFGCRSPKSSRVPFFESPLPHLGRFHACSEPLCCVVQRRHFVLIGRKPKGTTPFLRHELPFQSGRQVSESCEFCSKQFSNLVLLSLAYRKN